MRSANLQPGEVIDLGWLVTLQRTSRSPTVSILRWCRIRQSGISRRRTNWIWPTRRREDTPDAQSIAGGFD